MSVTELKDRIHKAIDSIDDTAVLQAILTMAKLPFNLDNGPLTNQELNTVKERKEEYLQGKANPIPWREVQERVKETHGL